MAQGRVSCQGCQEGLFLTKKKKKGQKEKEEMHAALLEAPHFHLANLQRQNFEFSGIERGGKGNVIFHCKPRERILR